MIAQTIYGLTEDYLSDITDKFFIEWGRKYNMCSRFGVGGNLDINLVNEVRNLGRILCQDSCAFTDCDKSLLKEKLNLKISKLL